MNTMNIIGNINDYSLSFKGFDRPVEWEETNFFETVMLEHLAYNIGMFFLVLLASFALTFGAAGLVWGVCAASKALRNVAEDFLTRMPLKVK